MTRHGIGDCRTSGLGGQSMRFAAFSDLSCFVRRRWEPTEIRLWRTGVWKWTLERETRERPPQSLRRDHWNGPSRMWGSVTPIVLHQLSQAVAVRPCRTNRFGSIASAFCRRLNRFESKACPLTLVPVTSEKFPSTKKVDRISAATRCMPSYILPTRSRPVLVGRGRFRATGCSRRFLKGRQANERPRDRTFRSILLGVA